MSRMPLIAGNWKMHGARSEALSLAAQLARNVGQERGREVVLAPPFTALEVVGKEIAGSGIRLGAQNVHWEPKGAFTGEVSVGMLKEAGCTHVIIGHSERRQFFGETNETVNKRLVAALGAGLVPIVCVGETLAEREGGTTDAVLARQFKAAFADVTAPELASIDLAYEPVWAIGTGKTATPQIASEAHAALRALLVSKYGPAGREPRILYGGSVKPANSAELLASPGIDGLLVGGASLEAAQFRPIVESA
jgi:triosephosphate isomerase